MSLRAHLATLDAEQLTDLLGRRPDVLVEPVPRDVGELASRLTGVDSLARALPEMDLDEVITTRFVALLGSAPVPVLASRLRSTEDDVRRVVDRLSARGLAWEVGGKVGIPERLGQHFAAAVFGFRAVRDIAKQSRVEDLRTAISGLGGDPAGLPKAALVELISTSMADPGTVAAAVGRLPAPARDHLIHLLGAGGYDFYGGATRDVTGHLVRLGLLVGGQYGHPELPREVVVALLLGDRDRVHGRPEIPPSTQPPAEGRAGAESAVLALTALLDDARDRPLTALKKGGVGVREQARLTGRAGVADPALWIDVGYACGLLTFTPRGYAVTASYDTWRDDEPAVRWAAAATAWFALDVAPTSRETDDGDVAPPLALQSSGGMLRRGLLRAAAGGRSVSAAAEVIHWFCPLHGYDPTGRDRKIAAARYEAGLLGVVEGDRLTALGELLVTVEDATELAGRARELLPRGRGMLVLQSDLTAMVTGQSSAATARLLAAAATPESRGAAATWRFSSTSVRAALDTGWTVDALRTQLVEGSGRALPQPLDYLLADVARRHGSVRIRGSRSCITGSEAEMAEILHTRALAPLHLSRLAPTVLTSPFEIDAVLAKLRKAGFSPMPEDADGVVIVPDGPPAAPVTTPNRRPGERTTATALARRLLATATAPVLVSSSGTVGRLTALNRYLDDKELALLADALDNSRDVRIRYRNKDGNRGDRDIAPRQLHDSWIEAWCYLRSGEREFTVAGIEAVRPVG